MTNKIELGREYQTRDRDKVVVLCVNAPGVFPVVGYRVNDYGGASPEKWTEDGFFTNGGEKHPRDLIPVPRKIKVDGWINVYSHGAGGEVHATRSDADSRSDADLISNGLRIACIHIEREVTEGEGL